MSDAHRKKKILHVISGDLWAGAEVMAFNLLRELHAAGTLDIRVLILNEGKLADELRRCGIDVVALDEQRLTFPQILRAAGTLIRSHQPDVIHAHRYKENLLSFLLSLRSGGIPLVSTMHGLPEHHGRRPPLAQRLKSAANLLILSRAFHTVAVSEDIRTTLLQRHRFRPQNLHTIHNGIEIPAATRGSRDGAGVTIGSSGRLFPVKDYPLMVEIAREVAGQGIHDVRFQLAGDGPGGAALQQAIDGYGLTESFTLRGHVSDMASFYDELDIYLNTSIHEGIPMTILEAFAAGLPVVAPAVGGMVEIIRSGTDGFLIDSRNPSAFTEKCLYLKNDPAARARMGRAARRRAEESFSAAAMAGRYSRLYDSIAPGATAPAAPST